MAKCLSQRATFEFKEGRGTYRLIPLVFVPWRNTALLPWKSLFPGETFEMLPILISRARDSGNVTSGDNRERTSSLSSFFLLSITFQFATNRLHFSIIQSVFHYGKTVNNLIASQRLPWTRMLKLRINSWYLVGKENAGVFWSVVLEKVNALL